MSCTVCYCTSLPMPTLLHVPFSLDFPPPSQLDVYVTDMSSGSASWVTIIFEESFCEKYFNQKYVSKKTCTYNYINPLTVFIDRQTAKQTAR